MAQDRLNPNYKPIDRLANPVHWQQGAINDIKGAAISGVNQIAGGYNQTKNATNPLQLFEGVGAMGAGLVNTALSPTASLFHSLNSGVSSLANKISDIPAVQRFANSKAGEVTSRVFNDINNYNTLAGGIAGAQTLISPKPTINEQLAANAKADLGNAIAKNIETYTPKKSSASLQPIVDYVSPKLTPTEEAAAKAAGRGTTIGKIFKQTSLTNTPREIEMGKYAQEAGISPSNSFNDNIKLGQDYIASNAQKLRTGLQQSDAIWNKNQVTSALRDTPRPITVKNDLTINRIANGFENAVIKLAEKTPKKAEGLIDLRQGVDTLIDKEFPANIYTKDTPLGQYIKNVRQSLNTLAENALPDGKLPDGTTFKASMRRQNLMYDVIDNIAEKAPKVGQSARPFLGRIKALGNRHPALKYGLGALGAERVLKSFGVPIPGP